MRCLNKNKVKFWYALYKNRVPTKDDQGRLNGGYTNVYYPPVAYKANISPPQGDVAVQYFGKDVSYSGVIVIDKITFPVNEDSILWVDIIPTLDKNGELKLNENGYPVTPHNYEVKKVAKSLNSVLIAIQKVDVDG